MNKKANRVYVEHEADHLRQQIEHSYYRDSDTVAIPITSTLNEEEIEALGKTMLEAIKKLTFIYWEDETNGVTFEITGSFGFKQVGQKFIYDPQAKKEKVLNENL
jgi:hypothetical protein